jgi:threonyl-tRNA synthetase
MSKIKNELKKDPLMPLRHTAEHVLQLAMESLYPGLKKVMGPPIENGFYGDFHYDKSISSDDLPKIEQKMQEIIDADLQVKMSKLPYKEAKETFKDNSYKLEFIEEINQKGEDIGVCELGKKGTDMYDIDICDGPQLPSTGKVRAFKLLSVAGAYWRGDENNEMLVRIYGTAFDTKEKLDEHLKNLEEAKENDHRKLGKELDLFTFSDYVGPGLPLYTTKGTLIRKLLNDYVEEVQTKQNYQQVWTPQIAKAELFKVSGHYDKYKDNMFKVLSNFSDEEFYLKPMNCPQHTQIYASKIRSYRDLPIRMTDFAMLYRDEKPGELSGLARVRSFSQDDCHIFCREDQVDQEVDIALSMTKEIMETFDLKYKYRLSTRGDEDQSKFLGDPKVWDKVEKWAVDIMKRNKIDYFDGPGEAAFYAPKMDLIATDSLGREWQLSTVQIDYVMPERFDLSYIDSDGTKKHPIMIHRAIVGSPERFIMILLEHFKGALPVWLSPVQVNIIPISENHLEYSDKVKQQLNQNGFRAKIDSRQDTMQSKIRDAQLHKVPYMFILGDKEIENNTVSLRLRNNENVGAVNTNAALEKILKINNERSLELW